MAKIRMVDIHNRQLPTFSVEKNEYIVFRNLDPVAHQLNTLEIAPAFAFDIGIIHPGEVSSPVLFSEQSSPEGITYGCGLHPNMSAKIFVGIASHAHPHPAHPAHDHDHDHLKHYHGFVTGGSLGSQIYMTHTPIFSDERHHFQIILEAAFVEQQHIDAYNNLRSSEYGQRTVQLFFDHLALIDIRDGKLTEILTEPERGARKYPGGKSTVIPELLGARIKITKILHFRTFDPDMDYPPYLQYLIYGNSQDIFIDHFISRAPNFHSVARLAFAPAFWTPEKYGTVLPLMITSKRMIDVSPKILRRVAFVDNRYHLVWGSLSGTLSPVDPLGPLADGEHRTFPVQLPDGSISEIQLSHLLHFDATRLLNEGLGF